MIPFEKYLIENGWLKYKLIYETGKLERTNETNLDTNHRLDYRYCHQDDKEMVNIICVGLNEWKHGPTVKWPRPPKIERDFEMDRILAKYSNEVILKAMFNKTIILEI